MNIKSAASHALTVCALVTSTAAFAHPQPGDGLLHGFAHPFSGLDHLLAMLIVGLWAARRRGATRLLLPGAFVLSLLSGALLGLGDVPLPATELVLIGSVLLLAVALATSARIGLGWALVLVAVFGLFHGYAHMAGMPEGVALGAFTVGMVAGSALLHAIGLAIGALMAARKPAFQP